MATILYPVFARAGDGTAGRTDEPCEIIIFTGVRVSFDEPTGSAGESGGKDSDPPRRSRKRRSS